MVFVALCLAIAVQEPPPPEITTRIVTAHEWVSRVGRQMKDSIWPGFRPDTIPVLYVIQGKGTLLLGWRGELPPGFVPAVSDLRDPPGAAGWQPVTDRGAASTGTSLAGRPAAQVVVDSQGIAALVGLTTHEAFHVFETASRQAGKRFGQQENAFLVTSYPVFDPQNEAGMALEGRILEATLSAPNQQRRRALARQFVAVREARHRALGPDLADFEQLAELNEGLAEYALVRSVDLAARLRGFPDRAGAEQLRAGKRVGLHKLTEEVTLSIRLRYYATGPALGLLLDALEGGGPGWKARLVNQNLTVQDALADASGYRANEQTLRRQAESTFVMRSLRTSADAGVASLRAVRRAQVDSALAAPGVQLVVTVEGRSIGTCGIDPQNLLQVEPGVLLHTRWVQVCTGDVLQATFNTPVVQERNSVRAVVGADSTVKVMDGPDGAVQVESPLVSLRAKKATASRDATGRVLTIKIKS
ncbi:MAG TPA: hypothetical protein VN803_09665 [Gemmatimonadales bacterium]|nr:hypothetical protein [Gemmatimonadales bacterium]